MNYPPYNYQPTYPVYNPAAVCPQTMQTQMGPQQNQGQQMAPQGQQQAFLCRPVTSREEAVAAQIDFMGPGTIMPDLGHGMIYLKRFNPNTGSSDFLPFAFQAPTQEQEPAFVSLQDFMDLQNNVKQLRDEIERLKKPPATKGVKKNDADE